MLIPIALPSSWRMVVRAMALDLILDSLTRSVSEGILGENKQSKPLADASGYKVSGMALAVGGFRLHRRLAVC